MGSSSTDWIAWVRGVAGMDDGTVVAGFWKQYWGFLYWSYPQSVALPPQSGLPSFLPSAGSRQLQVEGQAAGTGVAGVVVTTGAVVAGFWKQYWGFLYWSYPQRVSFPPQSVYPIFLASAESRQLQMEGQEPGEAVITMAGVDVGESVFVVVVVGVGVGVFGVVVATGGW